MGREGVTQDMRREPFCINMSKDRIVFDTMPESLPGHFLCPIAWKHDIQRYTVKQPRASVLKIILDPINGFFAKRDQPFFVAFTNHPHHTLPQTDIAER